LANGHHYQLYVYNHVANIPEGVEILDGHEIIPESERFVSKRGSHALFSDWFRWELLYRKGGYWVDLDEVCLRSFDFAEDIVFGCEEPGRASNI